MNVLVTGGTGMIGRRLVARLLEKGTVVDSSGATREIAKVVVNDVAPPEPPLPDDPRLEVVVGSFGEPDVLAKIVTPETGIAFHLAAIVSGGAEEDFDLGMQVNLQATIALFEALRATGTCPRVVFASSVATYGGDRLPDVITDDVPLNPQTSYGGQKAMTEFLINDYSRKGFFDGRALRLPTICVRPGKPNKAASSFASSIIREPLEGRAYACPVAADTSVWILSPRQVVESFLHAAEISAGMWGTQRALALPGITVTVEDMIDAMENIAGSEVVKRITWEIDPVIERIVYGWPTKFAPERALSMGFEPDATLEAIVQQFVDDELG